MNTNDFLQSVKAPVKISFEPTISCNLRCPMCDRTHKTDFIRHRDERMSCERIKAFLHETGRLGVKHFLIIGGGEPLTDPNLTDYLQILRSYGVYIHLWTNGTLISESNAPVLAEICDMITVSLDSPDPQINDSCRGLPGATERSIAGIRLLRRCSDRLYLRVHSVITRRNIDRLRDTADFAAENGINEIGGALITPFAFVPEDMLFRSEDLRGINNKLEDLCEYAKTRGIALGGYFSNTTAKVILNLERIFDLDPAKTCGDTDEHITCMSLWGQASVRPNGDVSVCCYTYKPVLGNLKENSFEEIWHSEKAEELRARVRHGEYLDVPCRMCDMSHPVFTRELEQTGGLDSFLQASMNAR